MDGKRQITEAVRQAARNLSETELLEEIRPLQSVVKNQETFNIENMEDGRSLEAFIEVYGKIFEEEREIVMNIISLLNKIYQKLYKNSVSMVCKVKKTETSYQLVTQQGEQLMTVVCLNKNAVDAKRYMVLWTMYKQFPFFYRLWFVLSRKEKGGQDPGAETRSQLSGRSGVPIKAPEPPNSGAEPTSNFFKKWEIPEVRATEPSMSFEKTFNSTRDTLNQTTAKDPEALAEVLTGRYLKIPKLAKMDLINPHKFLGKITAGDIKIRGRFPATSLSEIFQDALDRVFPKDHQGWHFSAKSDPRLVTLKTTEDTIATVSMPIPDKTTAKELFVIKILAELWPEKLDEALECLAPRMIARAALGDPTESTSDRAKSASAIFWASLQKDLGASCTVKEEDDFSDLQFKKSEILDSLSFEKKENWDILPKIFGENGLRLSMQISTMFQNSLSVKFVVKTASSEQLELTLAATAPHLYDSLQAAQAKLVEVVLPQAFPGYIRSSVQRLRNLEVVAKHLAKSSCTILDANLDFPVDFGFQVNPGNLLSQQLAKGEYAAALGTVLKMTDAPESFDLRTAMVISPPNSEKSREVFRVSLVCRSAVLSEVLVMAGGEIEARNTAALLFLTVAFPSLEIPG